MNLASLTLRMSRSENLPVIPQSITAIMRMADSGELSARTIEKVLERDPSVATKMLRVANSSFFGAGSVHSVARAVQVLGSSGLKSVVTSLAMQAVMMGKSQSKSFDRVGYWKHSLATAVTCRIIGRLKYAAQSEELYAAGLMHDVGLIIMDKFMPAELDALIEEANRVGVPLNIIERDRLGYTHAEVGALLAEKWHFSATTISAIRYHHAPELDVDHFATTSVLNLADTMAHEAGFHNSQAPNTRVRDDYMLKKIGLSESNVAVIEQVATAEVEKAAEMFHMAA